MICSHFWNYHPYYVTSPRSEKRFPLGGIKRGQKYVLERWMIIKMVHNFSPLLTWAVIISYSPGFFPCFETLREQVFAGCSCSRWVQLWTGVFLQTSRGWFSKNPSIELKCWKTWDVEYDFPQCLHEYSSVKCHFRVALVLFKISIIRNHIRSGFWISWDLSEGVAALICIIE